MPFSGQRPTRYPGTCSEHERQSSRECKRLMRTYLDDSQELLESSDVRRVVSSSLWTFGALLGDSSRVVLASVAHASFDHTISVQQVMPRIAVSIVAIESERPDIS